MIDPTPLREAINSLPGQEFKIGKLLWLHCVFRLQGCVLLAAGVGGRALQQRKGELQVKVSR